MEQSPSSEANNHSASQNFPTSYGIRSFITVFTKTATGPYPEREMNAVHIFPPYFPKIYSNILPSTSWSSKWSFPFRCSNKSAWALC